MVLFEVLHHTYVGMNCPKVSKGRIIKTKKIGNSVEGSGRE
jgi:hypothetical protein